MNNHVNINLDKFYFIFSFTLILVLKWFKHIFTTQPTTSIAMNLLNSEKRRDNKSTERERETG